MIKALPLLALLLAGCTTAAPGGGAASYPSGFPNDLKNDAYAYYGLGNDKPMRLEILDGTGMGSSVGTRTIRLDKIEDGKAVYVLTQTGALSSEGDITLSLEPDGLYTMKSSANKIKAHSLEMPAKLEVGGGWKDHTEMADQKIVLDNVLKIVGKERVSTPGGTFDDALHVTSTGEGTMQGGPVTLETESWYVRGVGAVKQILKITPKTKGSPARNVTVQLAAPEKPGAASATPGASPSGSAPTGSTSLPPGITLPPATSPSGTKK